MNKAVIIYWSGTGNTEKMAYEVAEGAKSNTAMEVTVMKVEDASKEDVVNADAVALGCPSMGAEVLEEEEMEPFVEALSDINWTNKPLALFGSYDWGDGEWMRDWEARMKEYGAGLVQEGLLVHLEPGEEDNNNCRLLGEKLVK